MCKIKETMQSAFQQFYVTFGEPTATHGQWLSRRRHSGRWPFFLFLILSLFLSSVSSVRFAFRPPFPRSGWRRLRLLYERPYQIQLEGDYLGEDRSLHGNANTACVAQTGKPFFEEFDSRVRAIDVEEAKDGRRRLREHRISRVSTRHFPVMMRGFRWVFFAGFHLLLSFFPLSSFLFRFVFLSSLCHSFL